MKQLSVKARKRHSARATAPKPVAPSSPGMGQRLPRWALSLLCVVLVGGATWAALELVVWNKIPAQLVGKWVIEGGEQDGATLDFFRGGAMVGRMNVRGNLAIVNAQVAVDGRRLLITTQNPMTKRDEMRVQTIETLNASQLVLKDDQGKTFRLSRATE